MGTLREYFDNDFNTVLNLSQTLTVGSKKGPSLRVEARLHLDFAGNAKYVSFYLPNDASPLSIVDALLQQLSVILDFTKGVEVGSAMVGEEMTDSKGLVFTGRVYFYSEGDISKEERDNLGKRAKANGLSVSIRGPQYATDRSKLEKPLAFICHDFRDKEQVARPIAIGLSKLLSPVWYDEFSLKVGDKLRESIEKGLKECEKCVLILSPNFLSNSGWTKVEFNSIFTRELIEKADLVLPVWCGVTKKEVYEYSPSLADRLAASWDRGADEVVRMLHRAIR